MLQKLIRRCRNTTPVRLPGFIDPKLFSFRFIKKHGGILDFGECPSVALAAMGAGKSAPLSDEQVIQLKQAFEGRMEAVGRTVKLLMGGVVVVAIVSGVVLIAITGELLSAAATAFGLALISMAALSFFATYYERLEHLALLLEEATDSALVKMAKWRHEQDDGALNQYLLKANQRRPSRKLYGLDYWIWSTWFEKEKPKLDNKKKAKEVLLSKLGAPLVR